MFWILFKHCFVCLLYYIIHGSIYHNQWISVTILDTSKMRLLLGVFGFFFFFFGKFLVIGQVQSVHFALFDELILLCHLTLSLHMCVFCFIVWCICLFFFQSTNIDIVVLSPGCDACHVDSYFVALCIRPNVIPGKNRN